MGEGSTHGSLQRLHSYFERTITTVDEASLCRRCMCLLTRVWLMFNCVIITDLNLWWTLICFRYWKEQEEWIVEKLFLETDAESQFEILMTVGSGNLLGVMKLSCSSYLKLAKKVSSDYFGKKILKWSFQCWRLVLYFFLFNLWRFWDTFLV